MTKKAPSHIETELAKFNVTDAAIAAMSKEYMPLSINGIDDKDGYNEVHAARMVVKGKRIEIEKTRKALKVEALAFGKAVDGEARRITTELESIEWYLADQEKVVDDEKERIKREKVEAILAEQERKKQAEIDRIAAEEEAARLAREKVMAEEEARLKAEQREQGEALRVAREKIEAEQVAIAKAMQKEIDDKKRLAELEKAKKEAVKAEKIKAEQKAEREAKAKAVAELKAKAEAERQEALKPDKDKLIALAEAIGSYPLPVVKDAEARTVVGGGAIRLAAIVEFIGGFTDEK